METEALLRSVIESTANLCHSDPSWLDEALQWRPDTQLAQAKAFFASGELQVLDAWPTAVPRTPIVIVVPGEDISQEEFVGSYIGHDFAPAASGPNWDETYAVGDMVQKNSLVVTYSPSMLMCKAVSGVMFWAVMVARQSLLWEDGLNEMNVRQGEMAISKEWSAPAENADVVFRRAITLSWKELFVHSTAFQGILANKVIATMQATYPQELVNG